MEKTQIVFATSNENKLREIRMILKDFNAEVISLKEAGINTEIIEDGRTFEENAVIKATTIMKETGKLTLADDYFKCNRELENIKRKYHDQEKEMYRLKHELVSMKMKYQTDNK